MNSRILFHEEVRDTLQRWNKEAAMHFCRMVQRGASLSEVSYPTGLQMVVAQLGSEKAEVEALVAKKLREDGYKVVMAD